MRRPGRFDQVEDSPVMGREDVEMVRRDQGGGRRTGRCGEAGGGAGARIDGLDLARLLDRHMHETARRIEEGGIRWPRKRPLRTELAVGGVNRDERATVTGGIE